MIGRILAWFLFFLAVAAAGRDGFVFLETTAYSPVTLADIWGAVDRASLQSAQGLSERYLHPSLRASILSPLARGPAWAVLAGSAVAVLLLWGRHRRRKWRSGALD